MKHISKKALAILITAAMLCSAVSCGIKKVGEDSTTTVSGNSGANKNTSAAVSTDANTQKTPPPAVTDNSQNTSAPPSTDNAKDTQTPPPPVSDNNPTPPPTPSGDTKTKPVSIDSFPENYNEFLSNTVFVGDSICSGLRVYGILPSDNVMAVGNAGARSIFDYTFNAYGTEYALPDALALLKPAYVVCSMGMNDVNMSSAEKFCENYDNVLAKIHETLPDAKIYVVSITPISASSTFCANTKLDSYNEALKAHLAGTEYTYLDVASIMKNGSNALADENNGGDGIHLSPAAYKAYLKRVCELTVK